MRTAGPTSPPPPSVARARHVVGSAIAYAAVVAATAAVAHAYVRTVPLTKGVPIRWAEPAIRMTLDTRDLPEGLTRTDALRALRRAAATWSAPFCTRVRISVDDGLVNEPGGHEDRRSSIAFHNRHFCEAGIDRPGKCYEPRAASVTNVRLGSTLTNGEVEVVEADIDLNAVRFDWSTAAVRTRPSVDLETVMLHELGHAIGLDHVCVRGLAGVPRRDHLGHARPPCENASPALSASIMVPAGDSPLAAALPVRRELAADDIAAVCGLYPAPRARQPGSCGCRLWAPRARGTTIASGIVGLIALWLRQRLRRR
jgi:hypothetical protein